MTEKQKQLLDFIKARLAETGISPSYQEMADAVGVTSKNGIFRLVHALAHAGHIAMLPRRARSISLPDTAPDFTNARLLKIRGLAKKMKSGTMTKKEAAAEIMRLTAP